MLRSGRWRQGVDHLRPIKLGGERRKVIFGFYPGSIPEEKCTHKHLDLKSFRHQRTEIRLNQLVPNESISLATYER